MEWVKESIEIKGMSFTTVKGPDFFTWLKNKYNKSLDAILGLSMKEREVLLLRWKHGLSDEANYAIEEGEKSLLFMVKDMACEDIKNNPYDFHIACLRRFNDKCFAIRKQLGLEIGAVTPEDEELKTTFNGNFV